VVRKRAFALIGDPKQAIYGFPRRRRDTYLDAGTHAVAAPPLRTTSARARRCCRLGALYRNAQAAFDAKLAEDPPFIDRRIVPRRPTRRQARTDQEYLSDGIPAPALTVWRAPQPDRGGRERKRKPHSAPRSRELATQACVAAIHEVLSVARRQATLSGQTRASRCNPATSRCWCVHI
jgi:exodeoxyribonuclease V beta subunit